MKAGECLVVFRRVKLISQDAQEVHQLGAIGQGSLMHTVSLLILWSPTSMELAIQRLFLAQCKPAPAAALHFLHQTRRLYMNRRSQPRTDPAQTALLLLILMSCA